MFKNVKNYSMHKRHALRKNFEGASNDPEDIQGPVQKYMYKAWQWKSPAQATNAASGATEI